jgi:hypothetical protein
MPALVETTAPLPGLSPVADKPIIAAFDAAGFSASGVFLLSYVSKTSVFAPCYA